MQTNFELVALVLAKPFNSTLSPGQMDLQVVASGRKLNLRRVLHWVAKRTHKFPHKCTQVKEKTF